MIVCVDGFCFFDLYFSILLSVLYKHIFVCFFFIPERKLNYFWSEKILKWDIENKKCIDFHGKYGVIQDEWYSEVTQKRYFSLIKS